MASPPRARFPRLRAALVRPPPETLALAIPDLAGQAGLQRLQPASKIRHLLTHSGGGYRGRINRELQQ